MAITTNQIPTITLDDLNHLSSSVTNDTINWNTTGNWSAVGTIAGGSYSPNTGYTYTTNTTTSPWIVNNGSTNPSMVVNPSGGSIEIKGEDADIKINGKSMVTWMEAVEERLNMLTPNPELEQDWDDLRRLGNRYRALEEKCKEKARMWEALKKVQPKQP